jgi:hypothetical protein
MARIKEPRQMVVTNSAGSKIKICFSTFLFARMMRKRALVRVFGRSFRFVFRDFSSLKPHFVASSAVAFLIRMAACSQVVSAPPSTVGASP